MILLLEKRLSDFEKCTYLPSMKSRFEYFFAHDLSAKEISILWENGWRKFGIYFFRPRCLNCQDCIPLRVLAKEFLPSRSQRRVLRKNKNTRVEFNALCYHPRIYEIYVKHSKNRFNQIHDTEEDFLESFYAPSCPAFQSEFYIDDKLVAIGFIDRGIDALSSVYFIYDTDYQYLNLGTFSVIKEIEYCQYLDLPYYYLGYYIEKCSRMVYKNRFSPKEHFDWQTQTWQKYVMRD